MIAKGEKSIGELLSDYALVVRALRRGVREALRRHKLLGESIVVWKNGKVVEIPPEKIPVSPPRRKSRGKQA